jgi:hypothetical protein
VLMKFLDQFSLGFVLASNKLMKMEWWEKLIPAIAIFGDPFVEGIGDCDG